MSDDYQSIPVAEARAAVQASGELVGLQGPEFWQGVSDVAFGSPWLPMFAPTDEKPYPEFARVIVKRKGQDPREVVISWGEYAAELEIDDPEWLAKRTQKPMSIFGAEVERHGYRVVFADILAPLVAPKRSDYDLPSPEAVAESKPERDWLGDVKVASATELNSLYDEARKAGALVKVDGLQQAFTDRLLELSASKAPAAPAVTPAQIAQTAKAGEARGQRARSRGRGKR